MTLMFRQKNPSVQSYEKSFLCTGSGWGEVGVALLFFLLYIYGDLKEFFFLLEIREMLFVHFFNGVHDKLWVKKSAYKKR